ncbi:aspartate racemase [Rhodovulum sulfidophilum]|uniref:Aspartate racemase n=1 Tax=Rhodovulum visakhapatnamense TaxID=364297 RepID=A0A4R8G1Z2_9RHOB|nr:aspartate/glutamate racemase family protein [Rhodovulum visakhapatnamense]MBL3567932.1 aspartate/glutamate racemase family protein [Rhodovulum visakhapatnamense]MBL3577322.1 aspartate/glutamate racemase family protein [Rhodovulum visakhapatnamense]OLS46333.1 aspartate racemase [Rhodovulum sulfidophilum]TDX30606.1 aspartate racemase [Rhodovulum visakhapatnamense]
MKTIGILGGMSAASTALYYDVLNRGARARLGGLHSADLLIRSLDFALVEEMQAAGDWDAAGLMLNREARALEAGGADFLMLATNTMHKLVESMLDGVSIPFLHIADATAHQISAAGLKRPGLMATAYTMEQSFYTDRLRAAGLDPMLPGPEDRAETHRIIYDELCVGMVREESRQSYVEIAGRLAKRGADCVILGCTEVGLLLNAANAPLPVFDTTEIHCAAALELALAA